MTLKITRKITSTALARVCVTLLVLYPVLAFLVWIYLDSDNYGILAAVFGATAGTAFLVFFVFSLPEASNYTLRALIVIIIAMISGVLSGVYWIWDEVDHISLRVGIIAPVLVILFVLMSFIDKVKEEGTKHEGE